MSEPFRTYAILISIWAVICFILFLAGSAFAAVDFDSASSGGNDCSSSSFSSGTVSVGASLALVFLDHTNSSATMDSVTWDGVAMTNIFSQTDTGLLLEVWGLLDPPDGVSTVVLDCTGSGSHVAFAVSYTGTDNVLPSNTSFLVQGSGTTISDSITTVADLSWVASFVFEKVSNSIAYTAGGTRRWGNGGEAAASSRIVGDSNADISPAGSYTHSAEWTGSAQNGIVMVELPVGIPDPPPPPPFATTTIPVQAMHMGTFVAAFFALSVAMGAYFALNVFRFMTG